MELGWSRNWNLDDIVDWVMATPGRHRLEHWNIDGVVVGGHRQPGTWNMVRIIPTDVRLLSCQLVDRSPVVVVGNLVQPTVQRF